MRVVLRSKIHRAWVTDANPDYVGSILIDQDLMDKIDLWNFEKVLVCDVTNAIDSRLTPSPANAGPACAQSKGPLPG